MLESQHTVLLPLLSGAVGKSINSAVATWSVCLIDKGRNSELGAGFSSGMLLQHKDLRIPLCVCTVCRNILLKVLQGRVVAQTAEPDGFCDTHGPPLKQPYFEILNI